VTSRALVPPFRLLHLSPPVLCDMVSLFCGKRWNADGYHFCEELQCPGPKITFTSQVVGPPGSGKLSTGEWHNEAWNFPHEPLRHMFITFEWALKIINPSSLESVQALERIWECIAAWIVGHHKGEDHVACAHFPEIFGAGTETAAEHKIFHDHAFEIQAMIATLIKDRGNAASILSNITQEVEKMKTHLFQHLADEEAKFPAIIQSKGWTLEQYCKWVAKDLIPFEGKAVKESKLVGNSDVQALKRVGVAVILLINCIAVWCPHHLEGPVAENVFPPFFISKAFKQCFEYRWVESLKTIERLGQRS